MELAHLLAGLASRAVLEEVCRGSCEALRRDEAGVTAEELRALWLRNLQEGTGGRVAQPEQQQDDRACSRASDRELHFRLRERCARSNTVQGCTGRPLPHMMRPRLSTLHFSEETPGNDKGGVRIAYQFKPDNHSNLDRTSHSTETMLAATTLSHLKQSPVRVENTSYPRVVAVSCPIPIHGGLVFLQLNPSDNDFNVPEGSMIKQYRICQTITHDGLQWCASELSSHLVSSQSASPPHFLGRDLQHSGVAPIHTSRLMAYAYPYILPNSMSSDGFSVKLKSSSGNVLSIKWPFFRELNQSKDSFERTIRNIRVINMRNSSSSVSAFPLSGTDRLVESILKKNFEEYEVAVALESHRVYKFDENGRTALNIEMNSSKEGNESLPYSDGSRDYNEGDNKSSSCEIEAAVAPSSSIPNTNEVNKPSHHDEKLDDENGYSYDAPSLRKHCGLKRSIHDILMGDDSSDNGSDECDGLDVEASDNPLKEKQYSHYDEYLSGVTNKYSSRNISIDSGILDVDRSTNVSKHKLSENNEEVFSDAIVPRTGNESTLIMKSHIAQQIYFTEWESDCYFSKMSKTPIKFRVENSRNINQDLVPHSEVKSLTDLVEDSTAIILDKPIATIIGTCSSVNRNSDNWLIRLKYVYISSTRKDFAMNRCTIRIKLPKFLISFNKNML